MNTSAFNKDYASEVENSVMLYFGAKLSAIVGNYDSIEKKAVVFILKKYLDFNQRHLARAYSINYLYVPTVVEQMEYQMKVDVLFKEKINQVLESIGYGVKEMDQGRRRSA